MTHGYVGIPEILRAAASDPAVGHTSVVDRAGSVHYDNVRGPAGHWRSPARAVATLVSLRDRSAGLAARARRVESLAARASRLGAPAVLISGIDRARALRTPMTLAKDDVLRSIRSGAQAVKQDPSLRSSIRRERHR